MATISNTSRPGYVWDTTDNVWYPIGTGVHTHDYVASTLIDAKGDLLVGSAADTAARLAVGTNNYVLTADSAATNGVKWAAPASPSFVGAAAYKDASQSISTGTYTAITFAAENFDTDAFHSTSTNTSRMTIPSGKAGKYLITGQITFQMNSDSGLRVLAFYKNGSALIYAQSIKSVGDDTRVNASYIADLTVGDYIEIFGFQNSGISVNVLGTNDQSAFAVQYLGA